MEPRGSARGRAHGRGRGRGRGRQSPSIPPLIHIDLTANVVVRYEESERGSGSKEKNSSADSDSVEMRVGKLSIGDDKPAAAGFDICPPKQAGTVVLKPPLLLKNREKRQSSNSSSNVAVTLRPGMVFLKGYLSLSDQEMIVKRCRELGVGSGGFYQPGYGEDTKMNLKMMCLGKNWDPQSGQYGDRRPFDGAKPPQIPPEFHSHVHSALKDANALLPSISPDICIVNFYSQTGHLGLHQDKDESRASLRRGLPVISFSIGDSADFLYADHRDLDQPQKLLLQSGDVLIFGGPSRNLFHGVTSIYPNTAPNLLLQHTNLRPGRLNLTFRQY